MRLDVFMTETALAESRTRAAELIRGGLVSVNGKHITKPSAEVKEDDNVALSDGGLRYVGRGALKLLAAAETWHIDFSDLVCADIGASTGGFTEVMLELGAKRVYAVDIGHGQLHPRLAGDSRVVNLEGVNARYMDADTLGERVDAVCADLSFISQTLVLEAISKILRPGGFYVGLIKPQFEAGPKSIGKGGIVKDVRAHTEAVQKVVSFAASVGFECVGLIPSPITGGDGNREFLAKYILRDTPCAPPDTEEIKKITANKQKGVRTNENGNGIS